MLLAECATSDELQKKICPMLKQVTERIMFRFIFRIGFDIMTTMILQNTISRFNLFWIESFDSWVCHFGWATKKKSIQCWSKEQRRLCSGLSFKFAFKLWLQLFCKIRFPDLTYFKLKVLIAECFTLKSHDKNICWM